MSKILNIGLDSSSTIPPTPQRVISCFSVLDTILDFRIVESSTERAVVVELADDMVADPHYLAIELGQECIPMWDTNTSTGTMHGPGKENWGEFNPSLFFLPTGRTLAAEHGLELVAA